MKKIKISRWMMNIFASVAMLMFVPLSSFGQDVTVAFSNDHWSEQDLNEHLAAVLRSAGFTGKIEETLAARLGRPINKQLADLGGLIFFDKIQGLHDDNSCAGCHAPATGFGDTQSIAIGVDNNNTVGPNRAGPRNQRRAPMVINSAFLPKLMWNGRISSASGDPFDNSQGFVFPSPEGTTKFPPSDPNVKHLLVAQGHIPQTELAEMAGFTGSRGTIDPIFDIFDDGHGVAIPPPGSSGFRNEPIRSSVLERFNANDAYRLLFAKSFSEVKRGGPITFVMIAQALAEFQISLTFANAPIDQFARGQVQAMTSSQKRGALLFFGEAKCVQCHAVAGQSNEMFSDFKMHVIGVPQIAPFFGQGVGNVLFHGSDQNEDFGLEQITGNASDRYRFRTSPLRNVALQPTFFHNGAFTKLEDAVSHHLNVVQSARNYDPVVAGVDSDLAQRMGPIEPVLERIDPLIAGEIALTSTELADLIAFVRDGLLDTHATPKKLCGLVPTTVPSGMSPTLFEGCKQ